MRRQLSQDICNTFEELPETVNADIAKLLNECEGAGTPSNGRADATAETEKKELAPAEKSEAEEFGKSENLIERILSDFEKCGLVRKSGSLVVVEDRRGQI